MQADDKKVEQITSLETIILQPNKYKIYEKIYANNRS